MIGYCIIAVLLTLYVSLWWGLIEPLLNIAKMIDNGTITAIGVVWQIVKIILREVLTVFMVILLYGIGVSITGVTYFRLKNKNKK